MFRFPVFYYFFASFFGLLFEVRWFPDTKRISISASLYTAKNALYSPFLGFYCMHKGAI